jgi:hypothetical protein
MHTLASPTDSGWLDILSRLPSDIDLNQLARETKAIRRLRGIADAAGLLRLGMVHGPGGMTLKKTAARAYMSGVARPTHGTYRRCMDARRRPSGCRSAL